MSSTIQRPPMRPETQAARRAYLNAVYLAESQPLIEETRREYRRLAETDPHCILASADEYDGFALATNDPVCAAHHRATAASLRAKAEAIMADEYRFTADDLVAA